MREEREAFCRYIRDLSAFALSAVEPLPFRRVLSMVETQALWLRLGQRWQIPIGGWYPLAETSLDVIAFNAAQFEEALPLERFQRIIQAKGITRMWELREYGPEFEEDVALYRPFYNGAEGYWSSNDLEWIVYASHENSITIGGWLLSDVKAALPSWKSHVWTDVLN